MEPIGYVYTERERERREIDMSMEAGKSEIYLQGKLTGWRPEEAWMLQKPFSPRDFSLFLLGCSTDWMRPTHTTGGNLLYS